LIILFDVMLYEKSGGVYRCWVLDD